MQLTAHAGMIFFPESDPPLTKLGLRFESNVFGPMAVPATLEPLLKKADKLYIVLHDEGAGFHHQKTGL